MVLLYVWAHKPCMQDVKHTYENEYVQLRENTLIIITVLKFSSIENTVQLQNDTW